MLHVPFNHHRLLALAERVRDPSGDNRFKPEKPTWTEQLFPGRAITLHFRADYRHLDRSPQRLIIVMRTSSSRNRDPPIFPTTIHAFANFRETIEPSWKPHCAPLQSGIRWFGNGMDGWMLKPRNFFLSTFSKLLQTALTLSLSSAFDTRFVFFFFLRLFERGKKFKFFERFNFRFVSNSRKSITFYFFFFFFGRRTRITIFLENAFSEVEASFDDSIIIIIFQHLRVLFLSNDSIPGCGRMWRSIFRKNG